MSLDQQLEAVLFWKAEPVSIAELAKIFKVTEDQIRAAVTVLEEKLKGRGVALVFSDDSVSLQTVGEASALIEDLTKEELQKEIGKAGLEALAIILYLGPISKREIEHIRGVNSSFVLRTLLIRGLAERVQSPTDQRVFLYKPTIEAQSYLNVSKIEQLPDYEKVRQDIERFKKESENGENEAKGDGLP
jgi:segregation and condensation protein B